MLAYLAAVPDPRAARGRRHPLVAILGLAAAAVLAGARTAWIGLAERCRRSRVGAWFPNGEAGSGWTMQGRAWPGPVHLAPARRTCRAEFTEWWMRHPSPTSQLLSPKPAVDQHRKLHLPDHRQKLVAWACRGDIGPDQASRQEDGPMNQVGSAARSCTEAHRGAGVPRRAGDP
ncbi:MAG TPA: transposase family protein [Actinomycetes bacterium]|nr:transposase family protein [Actinomycetes bacterium]